MEKGFAFERHLLTIWFKQFCNLFLTDDIFLLYLRAESSVCLTIFLTKTSMYKLSEFFLFWRHFGIVIFLSHRKFCSFVFQRTKQKRIGRFFQQIEKWYSRIDDSKIYFLLFSLTIQRLNKTWLRQLRVTQQRQNMNIHPTAMDRNSVIIVDK